MAYTFPLSLANFFNDLSIEQVTFDLQEALEFDETGGGEMLTADVGIRLWQMDVSFKPCEYREGEALKAKFDLLRYAGRSLFIHAIPSRFPTNDPTGSILAASSVTLSAVAVNNRDIQLSGLPVGFRLESGDCLSYVDGVTDLYYRFHRVINAPSAANGSGVMANVEVGPFIEPGFALTTPVTLIRPYMKAVYIPGTFSPGVTGGTKTTGIKASFRQTFGR